MDRAQAFYVPQRAGRTAVYGIARMAGFLENVLEKLHPAGFRSADILAFGHSILLTAFEQEVTFISC